MMGASQLSRSVLTWCLILGCGGGICSPVAASPDDVRIVATDPVQSSDLPTGVGSQFELTFWQSVSVSEDADQFGAYLARYPDGTFSALARAKIAALARRNGTTSAGATAIHVAVPAASPTDGISPVGTDDGDLVGTVAAIPGAATPVATVPVPAAHASVSVAAVKPTPTPTPPAPAEAAAVSASAAAGSSVPPSLAAQLRALSQSQGRRPEPPARQLFAIPARPQLASVPNVDLPDHFCTVMDRRNFYSSVYKPARSLADQNDQTATGHVRKLQSIHDEYAQSEDQNAMDGLAVEVRDYEALASDAHNASAAFEDLFDSLMAVPIRPCGESS